MKFLISSWADTVLRNDGGGGGDGSGAAAADTGAAAAAAAAAAAGASAADAAGQPSAAASPDGGAAAGSPYRPEGLPDHLFGTSDKDTIDKLNTAVKGFRQNQSDVPADAAAYKDFGDVDATIKPYMDQLTGDKLFDGMTSFAKEEGISKTLFQKMTTKYMALANEMGILEPPVDVAAERSALTPDAARHLPEAEQQQAREKRMNENFAFLDLQATRDGGKDGGLPTETVKLVKTMLGDFAGGHQFIEYFRGKMGGGGKGPLTEPNPGGGTPDARADLQRRGDLPENTPGHPKFDKASWMALQEDYKRLIPNTPGS